jgi:hypothetical protein
MRKSTVFWGIVVILAGVLLLLNSFGLLGFSAWKVFWPAFLILLGLWFLLVPVFRKRGTISSEHISVPIEDTSEAEVILNHGAGRLVINAAPADNTLLEGDFTGEMEQKVIRNGSQAKIQLKAHGESFLPFGSSQGFTWDIGLSRFVIYRLEIYTGASESLVNLADLQVKEVTLETGASSTTLTLPASAGMTRVEVKSGVAGVNLIVPQGVAGHIKVGSGLSGIKVDTSRFAQAENLYESADYATAANRVDIFVSSGLGSVNIQ